MGANRALADSVSAILLLCPNRTHSGNGTYLRNVPETWVTTSGRTGCRVAARFSAPEISEIMVHEAESNPSGREYFV